MIYELMNYLGDIFVDGSNTLQERMGNYLNKYNSKQLHPYKGHVVTIKSKQILYYINTLSNFDDKIEFLEIYNSILINVCKKIYLQFNPSLIYSFNDEINVVFYYNDNGNNIYNGNINKLLTSISSYTSIWMMKEFMKHSINIDFNHSSKIVEFDEDFEILNYLIFRQFDCKRNIMTLLYKCVKKNEVLDGFPNIENMKLKDIISNFEECNSVNQNFLTGNIIKKEIYYIDKNDKKDDTLNVDTLNVDTLNVDTLNVDTLNVDTLNVDTLNVDTLNVDHVSGQGTSELVSRKNINIEHFYLKENFTENLQKYIRNKIL